MFGSARVRSRASLNSSSGQGNKNGQVGSGGSQVHQEENAAGSRGSSRGELVNGPPEIQAPTPRACGYVASQGVS